MQLIANIRKNIQEQPPLVHNITNDVVTNFTANGLYAIGAQPVMANAIEEVQEMAAQADALVLNIGTLTQPQINAMVLAGQAANEAGTPVIFDPVGVGATTFRTETCERILSRVNMAVIRGNSGEIARLAGLPVVVRGVDSAAELEKPELAAKAVAEHFKTTVVMTGEIDVITDGEQVITCSNGHPLQAKVTGTGCLLTAITGAYVARHSNTLEAATAAVAFYGAAAEQAASLSELGPGSFQVSFMDQLYAITDEDIQKRVKLQTQEEGGA